MKKYKYLIMIILGILSVIVILTGAVLIGFRPIGKFNIVPLGIASIVLGVVGLIGELFMGFFWWED